MIRDEWYWDYRTQEVYRMHELPRDKMWTHICPIEGYGVVVDKEMPCHYCGIEEEPKNRT